MTWSRAFGGVGLAGLLAAMACGGAPFTVDGGGEEHDAADEGGGQDGGAGHDGSSGVDASDDHTPPPADAATPPDASDGGACVTATLTFELRASGGKAYCVGGSATSCGVDWLSVRPVGGSAIPIDQPCTADCTMCQPVACPALACAAPGPLPGGGVQRAWGGMEYVAGTCGANALACVTPTCVAPGHYIATMCAYPRLNPEAGVGACLGSATASCVEVPFEWPPAGGSGVVQGTLGASTVTGDGG